MEMDYNELIRKCATYTTCQSCTSTRKCGFFYNTGVCVPGGWLSPNHNYTSKGDIWSYYHGQCYFSTHVEFILLPVICGLLILTLAITALWQSWPVQWCGLGIREPTTPHASPHTSFGCRRESNHFALDEDAPLLIDNDPSSRQTQRSLAPRLEHEQAAPIDSPVMSRSRRQHSNASDALQAGNSFEEQYGSWCHRSGHMVQGGSI